MEDEQHARYRHCRQPRARGEGPPLRHYPCTHRVTDRLQFQFAGGVGLTNAGAEVGCAGTLQMSE